MNGFVADEHVPFATIRTLREAGYRVLSIREEHQSIEDELILEIAEKENLVIITLDGDFGDLIYKEKVPFKAGLIYCRLSRLAPDEIAELILYHIHEFAAEFAGKFTVLSRGKFRQREL